MPPHERKVLALLKADESTQIDDIVEKLEGVMSSSEIFAALFDLELAGQDPADAGKKLRQDILKRLSVVGYRFFGE